MKYLSQYITGKKTVKTAGEAQDQAIAWQKWVSEQSLSYGEFADWQHYFEKLANEFDLTEEFKENGIIEHFKEVTE